MKNGFIILTPTVCQGNQSWYKDENGRPVIYDTERDAQLEMADEIEVRACEFRDGDREFSDIGFEASIVPCVVHDDGSITTATEHDFEWRPTNGS